MTGPSESETALAAMMCTCRQILSKLMRRKGCSWFNSPVDVKGMNLADYNYIVKQPMDLGTVKSNLNKGMYQTPLEFAAGVRLTFTNALLYNPKDHIVHKLAGQLLQFFDDEFGREYKKYEEQSERQRSPVQLPPRTSTKTDQVAPLSPPRGSASPDRPKQQNVIVGRAVKPKCSMKRSIGSVEMVGDVVQRYEEQLPDIGRKVKEKERHGSPARKAKPVPRISPPRSNPIPARASRPQLQNEIVGKRRLPEPKCSTKRPMSSVEKMKLVEGLQSLPQEMGNQVLQIVTERIGDPQREGNEVELDVEAMDTDTLWELERIVGKWQRMMSKIRRQDDMVSNFISTPPSDSNPIKAGRKCSGDPWDEDVEIGDEMPAMNYPPVEIKGKNGGDDTDSSVSSGPSGSEAASSSRSDSDDDG